MLFGDTVICEYRISGGDPDQMITIIWHLMRDADMLRMREEYQHLRRDAYSILYCTREQECTV